MDIKEENGYKNTYNDDGKLIISELIGQPILAQEQTKPITLEDKINFLFLKEKGVI